MEPCVNCGRTFNTEALARHQPICQKVQNKPRKVFDSRKQRILGTEMERYSKPTLKGHASSAPPNPGRQKTLSWRQKHEDFIQTVRMARQLSDAAKSGAPLPAMAPSGPNPDYVQCNYCQRHFEPGTAERHIPFCKQQASKVNKTPGTVDPKAKDSLHKRTHYKPPSLKKKSTPNNSSDYNNRAAAPPGSSVVKRNTNFGDTYTFSKPLYNPNGDTDNKSTERESSSSSSLTGRQEGKSHLTGRKAISNTKDHSSVRATSFSRMSRVPQPSLFDRRLSNGGTGGGGGGGGGGAQPKAGKTHNSASRRLFAALEYSDHSPEEGGGDTSGTGRYLTERDDERRGSRNERGKTMGNSDYDMLVSGEGSNGKIGGTTNKDKIRGGKATREMFVINEGSIDHFNGSGYTVSREGGYYDDSKERTGGSNSPSVIGSGDTFPPGDDVENYSSFNRDKLSGGSGGPAVFKERLSMAKQSRPPFGGLAMAADHHNTDISDISKPVKPSPRQAGAFLNEHGLPLSKFCYECGSKFPVPQAKYCCECGTKRI